MFEYLTDTQAAMVKNLVFLSVIGLFKILELVFDKQVITRNQLIFLFPAYLLYRYIWD
jgi:hypothetical protein